MCYIVQYSIVQYSIVQYRAVPIVARPLYCLSHTIAPCAAPQPARIHMQQTHSIYMRAHHTLRTCTRAFMHMLIYTCSHIPPCLASPSARPRQPPPSHHYQSRPGPCPILSYPSVYACIRVCIMYMYEYENRLRGVYIVRQVSSTYRQSDGVIAYSKSSRCR